MGAALSVIYIIAKAKYILMELIHILERALNSDSFRFPLKVNHIVDTLPGLVHVLDKTYDPFRLVVLDMLCLRAPFIFINNSKLRVQIGRLVKAALYIILLETGLVKDGVVRQEIDSGAGLLVFPTAGRSPSFSSNVGIPRS